MLVGASNPCPCGLARRPRAATAPARRPVLARYRAKLSGALLDRIDIVLRVEQPSRAELRAEGEPEPSAAIRERVIAARARQREPAERHAGRLQRRDAARPSCAGCAGSTAPRGARLPTRTTARGLTMRGHDRAMRVARTLADLDGCDMVQRRHVAQAVAYRAAGRPGAAGGEAA